MCRRVKILDKMSKKGPGRRKGGIAQAARVLPVRGKTDEAKRKGIERSINADKILPEAKDAVKKAGITSRSDRLKIAAEKTLDAQLAKVAELAAKPKAAQKGKKKSLSAGEKKVLAGIMNIWSNDVGLKSAFIKASPNVREAFIAKIKADASRHTTKG